MMRYLSVCSGLEGATLAWHSLGWTPIAFAEIEAFPSAVIAHHYGANLPGEALSGNAPPNFGDFTKIDPSTLGQVDILVGGTPCQAFSVAGKRLSLADARGNLTLAYVALAHELARSNGLRNAVWENVPGALNTKDNAFGCFLGALVGHDSAIPSPHRRGWPNAGMVDGPRARAAWRVLDAQYFGVPQRRERVFVVADFGNGADPAQVLFEPASLHGNFAPSRKAGEGITGTVKASSARRGGVDEPECGRLIAFGGNDTRGPIGVSTALNAHGGPHGRLDFESETFVCAPPLMGNSYGDHQSREGLLVAHSLLGEGFDASEDGTGRGTPIVPVCFYTTQITNKDNRSNPQPGGTSHPLAAAAHAPAIAFQANHSGDGHIADVEGLCPTLRHGRGGGSSIPAVAFDMRGREGGAQFEGPHDTANIRAASGGSSRSYVATQWAVRRLTPKECARLQGVPDDYLDIIYRGKPAADGPKYKALGNSWAVPVVFWIGKRIDASLRANEAA